MILIKMANWPALLWPLSDNLPDARLDIQIRRTINERAFVGFGYRGSDKSSSQLLVFSGYQISKRHELFAAMALDPPGFGLGYGYQKDGLMIRFMMETGNVFGYAPYTSISWRP